MFHLNHILFLFIIHHIVYSLFHRIKTIKNIKIFTFVSGTNRTIHRLSLPPGQPYRIKPIQTSVKPSVRSEFQAVSLVSELKTPEIWLPLPCFLAYHFSVYLFFFFLTANGSSITQT